MAKANNHSGHINLGVYSSYYMKGCDRLIIRKKGGPSRKVVKNSPKYVPFNKNGEEFGGASKVASKILASIYAIKHLSTLGITGRLTSIACRIKALDTINALGQRAIAFSKYPHVLEGFEVNSELSFGSVITNDVACTISRSDLSAVVTIPDLHPGVNIALPWNTPLYRFILVFGIVPDISWSDDGYSETDKQTKYFPVQLQTNWSPASMFRKAEQLTLQLPPESNLANNGSLVVAIGIEAGNYITDNIITAVKQKGCGKILAQV